MASIQEINSSIMWGDLTNDQLNSIIAAVKFRRTQLTREAKRSLMLGDSVKFTSSKTGQTLQGNVTKIAIKYITVRTSQGLWKVPGNMLEAA